jgi:hypothetical protein
MRWVEIMASIRLFWLLPVALAAMPASANAASRDVGGLADKLKSAATFCNGTYALCIKAPCMPMMTQGSSGPSINSAMCSCEVVKGWSMGPASCPAREEAQVGSYSYLMSTYSNRDNATNKTLSCSNPDTLWAYCYGAPCVVDPKNPDKASCNCPVKQSAANTLGGDYLQAACSGLWSAATPAADAGANAIFAAYMKKNQPSVPSLPPAEACPATSAPGAR